MCVSDCVLWTVRHAAESHDSSNHLLHLLKKQTLGLAQCSNSNVCLHVFDWSVHDAVAKVDLKERFCYSTLLCWSEYYLWYNTHTSHITQRSHCPTCRCSWSCRRPAARDSWVSASLRTSRRGRWSDACVQNTLSGRLSGTSRTACHSCASEEPVWHKKSHHNIEVKSPARPSFLFLFWSYCSCTFHPFRDTSWMFCCLFL